MAVILCVDDNPSILTSLTLILEFAGHKCLTASTIEEAEERYRSTEIGLLIVDSGFPGLSGGDLAGNLKQIQESRVLMFTGNLEIKEAPANVDVLVHKPCPPREFLKIIDSLTPVA